MFSICPGVKRNGYLSFNEIKEALQLCLDINDLNALRGDLFIDEKSENLNDLLDETVIILFGKLTLLDK